MTPAATASACRAERFRIFGRGDGLADLDIVKSGESYDLTRACGINCRAFEALEDEQFLDSSFHEGAVAF